MFRLPVHVPASPRIRLGAAAVPFVAKFTVTVPAPLNTLLSLTPPIVTAPVPAAVPPIVNGVVVSKMTPEDPLWIVAGPEPVMLIPGVVPPN